MKRAFSRLSRTALLACLAGLTAGAAHGQTFNEVIGLQFNETARYVIQTRDGGYATVGTTQTTISTDPSDILVNRLAADGSVIWSVKFGGPNADVGYHIQQTDDGGFIVAAETTSVNATLNLALLRLDAGGGYMWSWVYDGDTSAEDSIYASGGRLAGLTVRELRNGDFALTGRKRFSPNTQDQTAVLVRTQPNGVQIFNRRYGDVRFASQTRMTFTDLRELADGSLIISGTEEFPNTDNESLDPIIARVDPAGNPIFFRNYPLSPNLNFNEHGTGDGIDFIGTATAPSIVITGKTDASTTGANDLHVIRTDIAGNLQFYRGFQRMEPAFRSIHEDMFAKLAIGGRVLTAGTNDSDAMLLRVDAVTGGFDLGMAYGFMDAAAGMSPVPLKGGYALIGTVTAPAPFAHGGTDAELIQTNNVGDVPCLATRFERTPVPQPMEPPLFQPILLNSELTTFWQGQYTRWQQRVNVVCDNACAAADFNNDGNVDPDDLGDYINCYFAAPPCPLADFNNDGNVDPDDLGDYINIYFGCAR